MFDVVKFLKNRRQYFPFIFLALFIFVFHFIATDKFSDDIIFMETNPLQDGLIPLITDIYNNWTSRLFIYPTMVALSNAPIFIWRVLELAALLLLAVSISKLVIHEEKYSSNCFLVGFMLLYPYWHMATAGWIATTTNFTFPLALGTFALLTLKRIREGVNISIPRYIFYIIAILYSTDAEQGVMILFVVFTTLTALQLYNKSVFPLKYKITLYCSLLYSVARLVFTLTTPGNSVRALAGHWQVPEFAEYSLFQRILLGFELTAMHYTTFTIMLFPLFSLFLIIIVWHKHRVIHKRIIAAIPFVISVFLSALTAINAVQFARANLAYMDGQFLNTFIMITIPNWTGSNFIFLLFFICLFYTLYLSCSNFKESCFVIGVMLLGVLSQLVLGLSPSLYGSAFRTFIYASFAMIACATYLYDRGASAYIGKLTKVFIMIACMVNIIITFAISIVRMGGVL